MTVGSYVGWAKPELEKSCVVCGKIVGENSKFVHLSIDGTVLALDFDYGNSISQGCWEVGSECAKKFDQAVLRNGNPYNESRSHYAIAEHAAALAEIEARLRVTFVRKCLQEEVDAGNLTEAIVKVVLDTYDMKTYCGSWTGTKEDLATHFIQHVREVYNVIYCY